MIDFSGRVVLVTGAAGGIGSATARTLAAAGGDVVLHDLGPGGGLGALADELGEKAHALTADLGDPAASVALWQQAVAWRGRVDVLVNNAGIYEPAAIDDPIEDWTAAWERMLAICLVAPATLCREAIKTFRSQSSGGTIVNLASRAGRVPRLGGDARRRARRDPHARRRAAGRARARGRAHAQP